MTATRVSVLAIGLALLASACDSARDLDTSAGASHQVPFVSVHAAQAVGDLAGCQSCHGVDFAGGTTGVSCTGCHGLAGYADWQTNCTFCHGTRTPGWTQSAASLPLAGPAGVHEKHLGLGSTLSDGVACSECHAVPADLAHVGDGAAVTFGPLATQGGLAASYAAGTCSATYCHGARLAGAAEPAPAWTGTVACGDCHGTPPASGLHATTVSHSAQPCWTCHATVASDTAQAGILDTAEARALHVDGAKSVVFAYAGTWNPAAKSCSNVACHSRPPATRYW